MSKQRHHSILCNLWSWISFRSTVGNMNFRRTSLSLFGKWPFVGIFGCIKWIMIFFRPMSLLIFNLKLDIFINRPVVKTVLIISGGKLTFFGQWRFDRRLVNISPASDYFLGKNGVLNYIGFGYFNMPSDMPSLKHTPPLRFTTFLWFYCFHIFLWCFGKQLGQHAACVRGYWC